MSRQVGAGSPAGPDAPSAGRRNVLLVALTMVSACTDAVSYLGLGHVFPANMTGNTVLLGLGLASADLDAASRSATALGAFVLGAAVSGAALPDRPNPTVVLASSGAEAILLATLCGWWLSVGTAPGGAERYGLIALAGTTMGLQSGMIRVLDVPISTTYITGTWTALSMGIGRRLRAEAAGPGPAGHPDLLRAAVVSIYFATAFAAGYAYRDLGAVATALPLPLLAAGMATAAARRRRTADS